MEVRNGSGRNYRVSYLKKGIHPTGQKKTGENGQDRHQVVVENGRLNRIYGCCAYLSIHKGRPRKKMHPTHSGRRRLRGNVIRVALRSQDSDIQDRHDL